VSDRHDEEDDNFATGLSNCMLRDGRAVMTGDLRMGGYQVKNVAQGTASTDAVNKSQMDNINSGEVHIVGTETVTGNKTFSGSTSIATATVTTLTATAATVSDTLNIPGGKIWIA
jgi:enhancing lycopene biosynthesis protein 2